MLSIKTILHPTDFSERSAYAFELASSLARNSSARLIVLHIEDTPTIGYTGVMMAPPIPTHSKEEHAAVDAQLHEIRPADPAIPVEHRLVRGDPATAVIHVAEESGCDLIVMGTHGRTGLSRLMMGSVAEKVSREAPCPVLTVKVPPVLGTH